MHHFGLFRDRLHATSSFWVLLLVIGMGLAGCQPIVAPVREVRASPSQATVATIEATSEGAVEDEPPSVDAGDSAASVTYPAELVDEGLLVYRALYCGVCHVSDAAETRGTFGPTHNGMGATAVLRVADPAYSGSAQTPAEYIIESIVDPEVYVVPGYAMSSHRMPSYAHLSEAEIMTLTAFLLAQ